MHRQLFVRHEVVVVTATRWKIIYIHGCGAPYILNLVARCGWASWSTGWPSCFVFGRAWYRSWPETHACLGVVGGGSWYLRHVVLQWAQIVSMLVHRRHSVSRYRCSFTSSSSHFAVEKGSPAKLCYIWVRGERRGLPSTLGYCLSWTSSFYPWWMSGINSIPSSYAV
jgi:hypothetical protein